MLKTRLQPINRSLKVMLEEELGPEARSKLIASFARDTLAQAQAHNKSVLGYLPPHETYVDGKHGASEDNVRPDGTIIYEFDLLNDIFGWIGEQLILHAPVGSAGDGRPGHPGFFRNSFVFFADGKKVEPGAEVPAAREYIFASTAPYARKIERGYSDQAPDGVFEVITKLARNRYKGDAVIRFSYRALYSDGNSVMRYATRSSISAKAIAKGRSAQRAAEIAAKAVKHEKNQRTPCIVIQLRG